MAAKTVEIPEPPRVPLLGNVTDIDMEYPLGSFLHLANKYGGQPLLELDQVALHPALLTLI